MLKTTRPAEPPAKQEHVRWALLLPWVLVLLLLASNIGTLTNDRIHSFGFRALDTVLGTLSPHLADVALRRSSTRIAERERALAARQTQLARKVATRSTGRLAAHAAKTVESLPGRLIPMVGVIAEVSMRAYDVKNDCDTASDMNELLNIFGGQPVDAGAVCKFVNQVPGPTEAWSRAKQAATGIQRRVMDAMERMIPRPQ